MVPLWCCGCTVIKRLGVIPVIKTEAISLIEEGACVKSRRQWGKYEEEKKCPCQ